MSQATRSWIPETVQSLLESNVLSVHDIPDATMVEAAPAAEGVASHEPISTPLVTTGLFRSQGLDPDHPGRAAVARLSVRLASNGRTPCAPETGRSGDARQRLPLGAVVPLVHPTAREVEERAPEAWTWKGRGVTRVDGTTASMPDTAANPAAIPQPKTRETGLGFPRVRRVALRAPATGVVRDQAMGPYAGKETGAAARFRAPWDSLEVGAIVVGDRDFSGFFGIAGRSQRGVDSLFRMHRRRKFACRRGRPLGRADRVVTRTQPARPDWRDEETSAQRPATREVRERRVTVDQPGFGVNELVLVTTMLDAEVYTKREVADLLIERWNIEVCQANCTPRCRLSPFGRPPHRGRGGAAEPGPMAPGAPAEPPRATAMRPDIERPAPPRSQAAGHAARASAASGRSCRTGPGTRRSPPSAGS